MRHLQHLWRMRITFPIADILQHCDDIDAAFRQVLYTPELAIAFAYVFKGSLIPVGQVFGLRSAPSYFSLLSDIRAFVATCGDLITGHPMHPLAAAACLPLEPLPGKLAPAIADSWNQPMLALERASNSNSCFVDNNGMLRSQIYSSLHNSIVAAFLLFGWPHEDRRRAAVLLLTSGSATLILTCSIWASEYAGVLSLSNGHFTKGKNSTMKSWKLLA
jgi:hypothetical protein